MQTKQTARRGEGTSPECLQQGLAGQVQHRTNAGVPLLTTRPETEIAHKCMGSVTLGTTNVIRHTF